MVRDGFDFHFSILPAITVQRSRLLNVWIQIQCEFFTSKEDAWLPSELKR